MPDEEDDDLIKTLDEHLAAKHSRRERPLRPSERIALLLAAARAPDEDDTPLDVEIASMLRLIGLDPDDPVNAPMAAKAIEDGGQALGVENVPAVLQAYARGVGRIVAAEAEAMAPVIRAVPAEERPAAIARSLDFLLAAARRGFEVLHRRLLHDALRIEFTDVEEDLLEPEHMAVGMIDFVGSTEYLVRSDPDAVEELVDLLFEGAQWTTKQRRARVLKYVGDGVFIAGPDITEIAEVSLELVGILEAGSPLRARGGITSGHVVQRAGDIFGLPVNRAHILTKAARPGTVIADEPAGRALPPSLRARPREVVLPHPALGSARVVTVRVKR